MFDKGQIMRVMKVFKKVVIRISTLGKLLIGAMATFRQSQPQNVSKHGHGTIKGQQVSVKVPFRAFKVKLITWILMYL